jgi:hypothetical protein
MTDIDRISRHCASLLIENENLKIRIFVLEAALEPFSRFPIGVVGDECDEMEVYQCHGWPSDQLAVVTVADFWRARKTLGEQK